MTTMASSGKATVELPAPKQILITREFDAPRDLVYKAMTTPELVSQWWCGERGDMTVCEIDLQVGGRWRYVMIASSGGFEVAFHGEYKELVENERIVSTEAYEGLPEGMDPDEEASLNTMTLTEVDGCTTMTTLVEHRTQEGRDMHINSGMEGGMNEAFDRLEQVAKSLA